MSPQAGCDRSRDHVTTFRIGDVVVGRVILLLWLAVSPYSVGAQDVCEDDPTFDCAHISTVFDICADIDHARTVCKKVCNLCVTDPRDCLDALLHNATSVNGQDVYLIKTGATKKNVIVQCDMFTEGGGWTILLNRYSNAVNFDRNSTDYANGFGSLGKDYWIGLNNMHALTSDGRKYQLRVELTRADKRLYYEVYDDFKVGPAPEFVLHLGNSSGTAGDSLGSHSGFGFTTYDVDRDTNVGSNCAKYVSGGWWFHVCYDACLTCHYVTPGSQNCQSMSWNSINYCEALKSARMLMRPI